MRVEWIVSYRSMEAVVEVRILLLSLSEDSVMAARVKTLTPLTYPHLYSGNSVWLE